MAANFEMDPQATGSGLNAAGQVRCKSAGRAGTVETPMGNYTAEFAGTVRGLLAAAGAHLGAAAAGGLASTALSVTTIEGAETANANILTT